MQTVPESIKNTSSIAFYMFQGGKKYSKMLEHFGEKTVYENHWLF